jgi:hypothetical protein
MPEYEAPVDGYLTLRVADQRVCRFGVEAGETITLELEPTDDG